MRISYAYHQFLVAAFLASSATQVFATSFNFTTLDVPGAVQTFAFGISGSNVVGQYIDSSNQEHGFLFNGSTYSTLDDPLGAQGTSANSISGTNVVGSYFDAAGKPHGFLYNGSSFTTLDDPLGSNGTQALGVSGSNVVGSYVDSSLATHGFLYDGSTYTTLDAPGASATVAHGIDGTLVVGFSVISGVTRGMIYSIGVGFSPSVLLSGTTATYFWDVSGADKVGQYRTPANVYHGFLRTATSTTIVDDPLGVLDNVATSIDGSNIAGAYADAAGNYHGYLAVPVVPEPSTFALGILGALSLAAFGRRLRRQHLGRAGFTT